MSNKIDELESLLTPSALVWAFIVFLSTYYLNPIHDISILDHVHHAQELSLNNAFVCFGVLYDFIVSFVFSQYDFKGLVVLQFISNLFVLSSFYLLAQKFLQSTYASAVVTFLISMSALGFSPTSQTNLALGFVITAMIFLLDSTSRKNKILGAISLVFALLVSNINYQSISSIFKNLLGGERMSSLYYYDFAALLITAVLILVLLYQRESSFRLSSLLSLRLLNLKVLASILLFTLAFLYRPATSYASVYFGLLLANLLVENKSSDSNNSKSLVFVFHQMITSFNKLPKLGLSFCFLALAVVNFNSAYKMPSAVVTSSVKDSNLHKL